ncbi:ARPC4-domain-containing protein, partial [Rozella allomycis CSF55]
MAFRNKSTFNLLISLTVYKLCSFQSLIRISPKLISATEKLKLNGPLYWMIRHTFFKHFCGGENEKDVIPTIKSLHSENIGSILDLSVESDLVHEGGNKSLMYESIRLKQDDIAAKIIKGIEIARNVPQSFVALKVTSLVPPILLESISKVLKGIDSSLNSIVVDPGNITYEEFEKIVLHLPNGDSICKSDIVTLYENIEESGIVDCLQVKAFLHPLNSDISYFFIKKDLLTNDCIQELKTAIQRLDNINSFAKENGVKLMYDAEQSYFQPAIDLLTFYFSKSWNKSTNLPIIFSTYQMYLKESFSKLKNDVKLSQRFDYTFAAKIVRGAYMVSENNLAQTLSRPKIIHESIEDTHKSYDDAVSFLLDMKKSSRNGIQFMVATHNISSMTKTIKKAEDLSLSIKDDSSVSFGQLLGMCDFMSYDLSRKGYKVYKYVPYGPLQEVIPYLMRRAQENSSILGTSGHDQYFIRQELQNRFFGLSKWKRIFEYQNEDKIKPSNTLRPYLNAVRSTISAAICIQNFASQVVERHNKPEVEVGKEIILNPVTISRNENERVLIEASINSIRVSIRIKQADDTEKLLCHKFTRFLMQRAEHFIILRRKPVEGYDLSFLITNFHTEQMYRHKIVDFVITFMEEVDKEISDMKLTLNARAR